MSQFTSLTSVFLNNFPCKLNPTTTLKQQQQTTTIKCCSNPNNNSNTQQEQQQVGAAAPVLKKKKRYRRGYPGENKGITEEMRFVAMRLKNTKAKHTINTNNNYDSDNSESGKREDSEQEESLLWVPSFEGFLKYMVDSKLVFNTLERIVDQSDHVSYVYFRNTGLERSDSLSKDLEWFSQHNYVIPQPSNPGLQYVKYLEELSEQSAPLFLCHFYNIYFAHIAGGQVIAKQVSDKLLLEKELDFCCWEGDVPEMLKSLREKINMLSEHWSRDEKNKCLREATKSFRFLGQIVRLIIL